MKNNITYWFLYNLIDYTQELKLRSVSSICNIFENLYDHMDNNFSFGVSDLMKFVLGRGYDFDNWNNIIDVNLLKNKLIYYNYERFNKHNKIRYVKLERDVLKEAVLLYLKKSSIYHKNIDDNRLLLCYRDCLLLKDIWNKYLNNYGDMYILRINLDNNKDDNLKKINRFANMDISVNFGEFLEINLYKRLKNLIGSSMI